jgi:hypothetical protein
MANSLFPASVLIQYHSLLAPHSMMIPTKAHNPGASFGTFDTWLGGTVDAQDMIEELVTVMLPFFDAGVTFDNWTIFEYADAVSPGDPVASAAFTAMVGTDAGATWAGAVETMLIARTDGFGLAKLVLLDSISDNDFNTVITPTTRYTNLIAKWFLDTNGWSGRDNTQPKTFLKATKNLNQKLRKEYHYD